MRRVLGFSSRAPVRHGVQPGGHVARHSSTVSGLPWSYTPSRGCGTSTGIDPSPIQRKLTSRLGSVGQRCLPSQEKEVAKGACWSVTATIAWPSPPQPPGSTPPPIQVAPRGKQGAHTVGVGLSIIPSTGGLLWIEVEDSMRRSGRDDSTGKQVRIEDKARWRERDVAHVPERDRSRARPCFSRLLRHAQYSGSILSQTPHGKRQK
ncbi:hypothetical protein PoB_003055700 [Plakobranchus ocellatus]|uniref:Uncharacterized protein n=1 Tax=Plakobranchus ocellatus TaxID=259542 RepID=A0AAV4AAQ2_9GAST|nr:hypothetical protein PoB_003055700 [Plakobranchus ocellatus]